MIGRGAGLVCLRQGATGETSATGIPARDGRLGDRSPQHNIPAGERNKTPLSIWQLVRRWWFRAGPPVGATGPLRVHQTIQTQRLRLRTIALRRITVRVENCGADSLAVGLQPTLETSLKKAYNALSHLRLCTAHTHIDPVLKHSTCSIT